MALHLLFAVAAGAVAALAARVFLADSSGVVVGVAVAAVVFLAARETS